MERGDSPLVTRGHIDEPLFRAPHLALPTTLSQRTRTLDPGHPGTETIVSKGPNQRLVTLLILNSNFRFGRLYIRSHIVTRMR